MTNSIKKYLNPEEQLKELTDEKKLVIVDNDSKKLLLEYLTSYGYLSLIKKTSHPLMFDHTKGLNNKIYNSEFTSNNLRYLFDIDRTIASIIYKYFRNIEFLLNTSILKTMAKKLDRLNHCPYIATLSEQQFYQIFSSMNDTIANVKKDKSQFENIFYELFKNYKQDDINLKTISENNRDKENQQVLVKIKNGWFKKQIDNYAKKNKEIRFYRNWEYVDLYSIFDTLNFQQLIRIYKYLSKSLENEVIHSCTSKIDKKNKLVSEDFLLLVEILSKIRNLFSHNGFILGFKYELNLNKKKEKAFHNIVKFFDLEVKDEIIKLGHIIIIIEKMVGINNMITDEIFDLIKNKLNNRTKRSDNISPLLYQIIEDFSDLKLPSDIKDIK